jgi:hypothetical protein
MYLKKIKQLTILKGWSMLTSKWIRANTPVGFKRPRGRTHDLQRGKNAT